MPATRTMQTTMDFDRPPTDPNVHAGDIDRLTGQNAAILSRLRQGPATNVELAAISLNYRARISDLRKYGTGVRCDRRVGGVNVYRLTGGCS